ncbi:MAG: glycosyltransferase [Phycisphaera sp.]|nr:glycosyltransferase [Phycisphaera sp.]
MIAYLVNIYPHVSHAFIRRELLALQRSGMDVMRISIRRSPSELVDADDQREAQKTRVLLEGGIKGLLWPTLYCLLTSPVAFVRAMGLCLSMGRRSHTGMLKHAVYLMEACLLKRWARKSDITHVHAHFGTNPAAVALLCKTLGGPGYSLTVHGPEEFDSPHALSLDRKIAGARFVAAVSEFGRSQLRRWCKSSEWPKLHVVRCGVDAKFFDAPPSPTPEVKQVVCVGRLCEQKGQLVLVDALAALRDAGVACSVVFAGDGPMRSVIENRVTELSLGDRVKITGYLSGNGVRETILASRAMVLPSFAEGLPVVIMEAMALGRCVVSTYVAGIPELVADDATGYLIPAGSVDALAQALCRVIQTPVEELDEMGRRGAERVRRLHNAANEAEFLMSLLGMHERKPVSHTSGVAAHGSAAAVGIAQVRV